MYTDTPEGLQELAAICAGVYALSPDERERWYRQHPVSSFADPPPAGSGSGSGSGQPSLESGVDATAATIDRIMRAGRAAHRCQGPEPG